MALARDEVRNSVCWLHGLTLLVSLDSATGDLGRARVVSRQRVLFSFFRQNFQASVRTCRYIPIRAYVYKLTSWGSKQVAVREI